MRSFKVFIYIVLTFLWIGCNKDTDKPVVPTVKVSASIIASVSPASEPGTNGEFKINLSKSVSSPTDISYTISGTATKGTDFETIPNKVTVLANTLSVNIPIKVIDDQEVEGSETIILTLTGTNNNSVQLGSSKTATVIIDEEPEAFVLLPSETRSYMANPNATDETVALFYNLKTLSKTNFIIGQHDAFSSFYNDDVGDSDIKKATGSDPGLQGLDFMFITDDKNDETSGNWFYQQELAIREDAIEAYNKGVINAFCWHFREPYEGISFYTGDMTYAQKTNAFKSILPGGENHEYYKKKLEKIADFTKGLIGNDGKKVPIIFRPFHEFDGDWFWWGESYCTAEEFIEAWQFTVEYLRDTLSVNNMLFAFSPDNSAITETQYLRRYPGDNYVDIIGMDNYGDFNNQGQTGVNTANEKLQIISKLAIEKVKIAAMTETGYFVTPGGNNPITGFYSSNLYSALTNNDVEVGYMMFWSNNKTTYCTPVPGLSDVDDFIQFANKEQSLLEVDLPDMYTLPN